MTRERRGQEGKHTGKGTNKVGGNRNGFKTLQ